MDDTLKNIEGMNRTEISEYWREQFKEEAPVIRALDVLRRQTAWKLQENRYGGLKTSVNRQLRDMAKAFDKDKNHKPTTMPALNPGTTLTREWQGTMHSVQVLQRGFVYREKRYSSLSKIARTITGTRWSGPVFFGLKKAAHHGRAAQ
jgi:Protein of unknown function (DUF2924)